MVFSTSFPSLKNDKIASMKVIVGLGNIGDKYIKNRHNAGFVTIDKLAENLDRNDWTKINRFHSMIIKEANFILAKPITYMNKSGLAVKNIITHYKINTSNMWVIHDDLDIKLGEYKIQKGKGPREHKGLISIYDSIGKKDFWHVRVGVDNRSADERMPGEAYVLQNFDDNEFAIVQKTLDVVSERLITILKK